jgi:hypothetical protein
VATSALVTSRKPDVGPEPIDWRPPAWVCGAGQSRRTVLRCSRQSALLEEKLAMIRRLLLLTAVLPLVISSRTGAV